MGKPALKKKRNQGKSPSAPVAAPPADEVSHSSFSKPNLYAETPIYDLLHVFEKAEDQWAARYILILSAIVWRSAIGLGPFSGKGQKPINGDFEAQRHWMEISVHLPLTKWYFYDLQYWGLDYPPLSAYHAWVCGHIGSLINSDWFALDVSRGMETPQIKTFMRITSLISEMIVLVPAVMQLISLLGKKAKLGRMHQIVVITLVLFQPPLVLIDHGHFQYNSVMLGFFLFSIIDLFKGNLILASIWFMSSVLFKQMALHYSPFIFFFILSRLFTPNKKLSTALKSFSLVKLILVGATVVISTVFMILPFLIAATSSLDAYAIVKQILVRVFPFQRGLFEDKVANFWCTTNLIVKYREILSNERLVNLSLVLTLASILPPCLMCFWKNISNPKAPASLIIYGFSATAWGFFLFLFQVHEKTVLVPLIPSTFLLLSPDADMIAVVQWLNNIATFSLFPLLKRDGLALQYAISLLTINWLIGGFQRRKSNLLWPSSLHVLFKFVIAGSYVAVLAFHIIEATFAPPAKFPDLWVIVNTTISFGCFAWFYLWLLYKIRSL